MSLRDRLEYQAYRAASAVVRTLPLAFVQASAGALARLVFDLDGKRGRYTRVNLRIVLPNVNEAERLRIGRESFAHFAWNVIDFARAEHWSDEQAPPRT